MTINKKHLWIVLFVLLGVALPSVMAEENTRVSLNVAYSSPQPNQGGDWTTPRLTDGTIDNGGQKSGTVAFYLDFGAGNQYVINTTDFQGSLQGTGNAVSNWTIEYSNDNSTWIYAIESWDPGSGTALINNTFTEVSAQRYWKFTMVSNACANGCWVDEMGLWGVNLTTQTLNINLTDLVTSVGISGFCINATGTNTSQHLCNATGEIITFDTTGTYNITAFNITVTHSTPVYFNVSVQNYVFQSFDNLQLNTTQAHLNISAFQLFTNNTISLFNLSNGRVTNTSNITIAATNGTNNIQVDVAGNYSLNVTCVVGAPLTTVACNATNVFDDYFTIGANHNGNGITFFNVNVTNTTLSGGLLYNRTTSNGSLQLELLRGYWYLFEIIPDNFSKQNATLEANASTNLHNFTLLSFNTFEFNFYNESSNTQLTNVNITVQLVSDSAASNYTTSNGTLIVPLLVPEDYTIRYWREAEVPRDYYVTLTPGSYTNLSLYLVDADISNIYLPILIDQDTSIVADATIQLLRYYTETNSYLVVEMTKTDTNGQGVLRVVPNVINYKLLITKAGVSITTAPTKFTASTNSYTLNFRQNPLTSILSNTNITKSLIYNNDTLTFTFTWSDPNNIVTEGCLRVEKNKLGIFTVPQDSCSGGASGSIIYTINDTNQTEYLARGTLQTNTEYSTLPAGVASATFVYTYQIFGLTGFIIAIFLLIAFMFMALETGLGSSIVVTMLVSVLLGVYGFIASEWGVVVGIVIMGLIALYKVRG